MIALVEGAEPAEDAERDRAEHPARRPDDHLPARRRHAAAVRDLLGRASRRVIVLVALLVCLIPTTIGALLSAIGIAGMDRLVQRNVLAMSGRAVEAAGDCSHAAARQDRHDHARQPPGRRVPPAPGSDRGTSSPTRPSCRASPTRPRRAGRSWCWPRSGTACASASSSARRSSPFTAQTRMSGVDLDGALDPQGCR